MHRVINRGRSRAWMPGMLLAICGVVLNGADPELERAAEDLAQAGREVSRGSGTVPVSRTVPGSGTGPGVASQATQANTSPAVAESLQGVYAGKAGEGASEVIARFNAGKVQWIEPGKREWNPKTTNSYTYQFGGGKLTVMRPDATPLVYEVSADRQVLSWQSGELKVPVKQLKLSTP